VRARDQALCTCVRALDHVDFAFSVDLDELGALERADGDFRH
jgi:hypothetical protein